MTFSSNIASLCYVLLDSHCKERDSINSVAAISHKLSVFWFFFLSSIDLLKNHLISTIF